MHKLIFRPKKTLAVFPLAPLDLTRDKIVSPRLWRGRMNSTPTVDWLVEFIGVGIPRRADAQTGASALPYGGLRHPAPQQIPFYVFLDTQKTQFYIAF